MFNDDIVLNVENLQVGFRVAKQLVTPVHDVSFRITRGKTLGLVGESGCGKSVTAQSIMHLLSNNGSITNGRISYRAKDGRLIQLESLTKFGKEMSKLRGSEISMIFQDPMASLNPVYTIGDQITEGLRRHSRLAKAEAIALAVDLMDTLGIPKAKDRLRDYPHQFSGGMKQRVMIAIAMICNPNLLIADEPTTALDVTVQAQIIELMQEIQKKFNTSIIIITHNMGIVAEMVDDLAIMYMGRIVEFGTGDSVFVKPLHPYTEALLSSVPVLGMKSRERLQSIPGSTPDVTNMPTGCAFRPRCKYAHEQCCSQPPEVKIGEKHAVSCWRYFGQ